MPSITRSLLILALAFGLAPAATALTIDNFEAGGFTITDDTNSGGTTDGEQSGLATTDVVGGSRLVRVLAGGLAGLTAQAVLVPTPADDAAALSAQATGVFTFFYDGSPNGSPNGVNGVLNLDLSGFDTLDIEMTIFEPSPPTLQVSLWDSTTIHVGTATAAVTGINSLSLASFTNVDLSDIQQIRVSLQNWTGTGSIASITAAPVPEPGTGLMLSLGLAALAARRRRA